MTTIDQTATAGLSAGRFPAWVRTDAVDGVRAMLPWLIGVAPFGMVVGMTARANDLSPALGVLTGTTIYSGSAQITAIELLGDGAAVAVVVVSVLAINARLLFYGSSIAPHWRGTDRRFRALSAYLLVDPSYAIGVRRYAERHAGGHAFYLGGAITLWAVWHATIIVGTVVGDVVPRGLGLEHLVPLFLLAELTGVVRDRSTLAAGAAAGIVAVAAAALPMHSGLLVAIVVGAAGGLLAERGPS